MALAQLAEAQCSALVIAFPTSATQPLQQPRQPRRGRLPRGVSLLARARVGRSMRQRDIDAALSEVAAIEEALKELTGSVAFWQGKLILARGKVNELRAG